ncbi:putative RNA-directed DNA polymerase, eukaryota, reverse transcriptase zinc-binding domain protein [Tanacetum coccineum]|uniref:RNA-directed DNA polymerase, eukaryota, reverse transcriptase zinc-binding domain protein n=1 Tax=Tanacetum coccineum TaxID=301880 RepID=A0ABQ5F138_9ASTR
MGKHSITTDANGWTWIFRNNKNPNTKPIENLYHKYLKKVATSFYVSNIPDSLDAKGLWKAYVSYGHLVDAYIANKLSKGGFLDSKIHHVGGLWIWIQSPSSLSCAKFQDNASMQRLYTSIKPASPSFKVDECLIWIEINGLPLCSWGSNAFKKVAGMVGKFMFFEGEESTAMSSGRICISTQSHKFVSEKVHVEVRGENFEVHVHELDREGADSVEENSVDDLNDPNDNFNEMAHGINEDKIPPDIRITSLDCLWSDHTPILFHILKYDFGPIPFKLYNSWLSRDGFDDVIKASWSSLENNNNDGRRVAWLEVHDSHVVFPPLVHFTCLCPLDSEYLENHVFLDEIKSTIWGCGSNKAPDPDGANSSFFTLIPKVNNPIFIKDFRPISLIGIHYKIIAKILANRLSKVIDKIVSIEKSAFILGRQILDGPLILSEIRACLHLSRASVLVNGNLTLELSIKRGLRQGNPLSPFLFILVMEGLHYALSTAVSSNLIHEINLGSPYLTLSHLFYVDDVIITTEWNPVSDDEVSNMARNSGCAA